MRSNTVSNYGIAFLSVLLFGGMGVFALGMQVGPIVGLVIGIIVGLLVSILIAVERIFSILDEKTQSKNEN